MMAVMLPSRRAAKVSNNEDFEIHTVIASESAQRGTGDNVSNAASEQ